MQLNCVKALPTLGLKNISLILFIKGQDLEVVVVGGTGHSKTLNCYYNLRLVLYISNDVNVKAQYIAEKQSYIK